MKANFSSALLHGERFEYFHVITFRNNPLREPRKVSNMGQLLHCYNAL